MTALIRVVKWRIPDTLKLYHILVFFFGDNQKFEMLMKLRKFSLNFGIFRMLSNILSLSRKTVNFEINFG